MFVKCSMPFCISLKLFLHFMRVEAKFTAILFGLEKDVNSLALKGLLTKDPIAFKQVN